MGNNFGLGTAKTPAFAVGTIGWWPCLQSSSDTNVADLSGNANNLSKGGAITWDTNASTGVWETAYKAKTRYSTAVTTNSGLILANSAMAVYRSDLGDSLVIAWRGNMATPAAAVPIFANSYMTTNGIRIRVSAAQKLQVSYYGAGVTATLTSNSNCGGGIERHHLVAIDGENGQATYYQNGERDATITSATLYPPLVSLVAPSLNLGVGGGAESSSNFGSILCSFSEINIVRRPSLGLPSNMDTIARFLYRHRFSYISEEMGW